MNQQQPTTQMLIQVSQIPVPMQANQPNEALPAAYSQLTAEVAKLAQEMTAAKNELLAQRSITDGFADTVQDQTVLLDSFEEDHTNRLARIEHHLAQLASRESTTTAQVTRLEDITGKLVAAVKDQVEQTKKLEHAIKLLPAKLLMKVELKEKEQASPQGESTMFE